MKTALILVIVVLSNPSSALSAGRITCVQLLIQSTSDQTRVVANLRDGFGAAFGLFNSFSSTLLTATTDPREKQGVRALESGFRALIHDGQVPRIDILVSRVVARCQEKPTQYAANSLVDVLMEIDNR